jgi:hypothetical protein
VTGQSKYVRLREALNLLYNEGYRSEAERLHGQLLRDLEGLSSKTLMDDYQLMLLLVYPVTQQPGDLIWCYHWTGSNDLEKRPVGALTHARKLAKEEK